MNTSFLWTTIIYIQTNLSLQSHYAFSNICCLDVQTNLHLSIICRCKHSANSSHCHDGKWNDLSSWKNKCCVGSLKWCNTGSLESHSVFGNRTVCVISAQPVGWRAISQALWINLWQELSRIKLNWTFNLTCPRAESSLVINQDREDWIWPLLGVNVTYF